MELLELTNKPHGTKIAIPIKVITGFCGTPSSPRGNSFVATGADAADGGENGWYVEETYDEIKELLKALENIRSHMKMMLPDNYEMSAAWNIANRAIKEYEDDK